MSNRIETVLAERYSSFYSKPESKREWVRGEFVMIVNVQSEDWYNVRIMTDGTEFHLIVEGVDLSVKDLHVCMQLVDNIVHYGIESVLAFLPKLEVILRVFDKETTITPVGGSFFIDENPHMKGDNVVRLKLDECSYDFAREMAIKVSEGSISCL